MPHNKQMSDKEETILTGKANYSAETTFRIEIVKTAFKPGSGDNEDPPEIRNDEYGEFYKIMFTPSGGTVAKSEGSYFSSLDETKNYIEANYKDVVWV